MKTSTTRAAGALSLVLLANLLLAPTVHAADHTAGPRDTVRIKRAPKQPETQQFAALEVSAVLPPAKTDSRGTCDIHRVGPRDTIARCR